MVGSLFQYSNLFNFYILLIYLHATYLLHYLHTTYLYAYTTYAYYIFIYCLLVCNFSFLVSLFISIQKTLKFISVAFPLLSSNIIINSYLIITHWFLSTLPIINHSKTNVELVIFL